MAEVDDADLDTLVVAGGNGVYALLDRPEVVAEVRRLAAAARRVASVCTGAYLLAGSEIARLPLRERRKLSASGQ